MDESAKAPFDDQSTRRNRIVLVALVVGVLILSGAVGTVVLAARRSSTSSASWVTLALSYCVLVLVVGLWSAWLYRRPRFRDVMSFTWSEKRRVKRKLLKNRPLTEDEIPAASALIQLQRRQRRIDWVYFVQLPIWLLQAAEHHGLLRWMSLALAACWLVIIPLTFNQRHRMERNFNQQTGRTTPA